MPNASGFVVPKMNPTSHVGNIRLLRPMIVTIKRQEDDQTAATLNGSVAAPWRGFLRSCAAWRVVAVALAISCRTSGLSVSVVWDGVSRAG